MVYHLLRKDLIPIDTKCEFCSKTLKSGKGYLLINDLDSHVYAGKKCAMSNAFNGDEINKLPDLTRYTISPEDENGNLPPVRGGHGGRPKNTPSDEKRQSIEYLILRQQLLRPYLPGIAFSDFDKYYLSYQEGTLDDKAVRHIINVEKKAPDKLKLKTLQKCYNYLFWIDVAVQRIGEGHKGTKFLQGVRDYLIKNHSITDIQKDKVNRWLQYIDNVAMLK